MKCERLVLLTSPKITMMKVLVAKPIAPVVRSARRMDRAQFVKVFPSRRVHSNRLPLFLMGRMVLANCLSFGSPPSTKICIALWQLIRLPHCNPSDCHINHCSSSLLCPGCWESLTLRPTLSSDSRPMVRPANRPVRGMRKTDSSMAAQTGKCGNDGRSP